jgi:hypothetical protein
MHGGKAMTGNMENDGRRLRSRWRIAAWGTAAALILLPWLAMQVTDDVNWDATDFAFASALILGTGLTYELAARMTRHRAYRAAVGVALAAACIIVWVNAAVGIIGSADNNANLMHGRVLAVGIVDAIIARFQPYGMARALVATAIAQALVAAIALVAELGSPGSGPLEIMALNGFFAALWLLSAWLFRKAAREQTPAGTAPSVDPRRPLSTHCGNSNGDTTENPYFSIDD